MSYMIPEKWRAWSDKWAQIHPDRGGDSVNGVQFASEVIILAAMSGQAPRKDLEFWWRTVWRSVTLFNGKNYTTKQTPTTTYEKDRGSHDNETLLASASWILNQEYHPNMQIWGRHWHPRDMIYYGIMKGYWWARLFLWLLIPSHIFSCARAFKSFGNPETSTKILAYFRMLTLYQTHWEMRLCYKICTWIIKKNKGLYSNLYGRKVDLDDWHKNIQYYFKYDNTHPVTDAHKVFRERYNGIL